MSADVDATMPDSQAPGPVRRWPNGARFAFSVLDDTDGATVARIRPVYELMHSLGMRTTKSVWVYPSRDRIGGDTIDDPGYLAYVRSLKDRGFELCLHGVGDGAFSREEILAGHERFREEFGGYPRIHANHSRNIDNLHWGSERFVWPVSLLFRLLDRKIGAGGSQGHVRGSRHYWGDLAKQHVEYVRNLVFNRVDTLGCDPRMPYPIAGTQDAVNNWFSSSDGHTVDEFCRLIHPDRIRSLERSGGACLVYTHFAEGFVDGTGTLHPVFEERMRHLASRPGWFVPMTTVLDRLRSAQAGRPAPGYPYLLRVDARWALERVEKLVRFRR